EAAVPRSLLESEVRGYLQKSLALETVWKFPITAEALRHELDRMRRGTRMPERLDELFSALGNDAFVIQECLVRPVLADRLARSFYLHDARIHAGARDRAQALRDALVRGDPEPTAAAVAAASAAGARRVLLRVVRSLLEPD